jgi:DNA-directed RNA polymerase specialized sigma24 family protein
MTGCPGPHVRGCLRLSSRRRSTATVAIPLSGPQYQMPPEATQPWRLNQPALERLLLRLSEEPEKAAREYEAIRGSLLVFFDLRGAADSAALADEALDRVARRLEQGEDIEHPRAYVYGVAKNVVRESVRQRERERAAIKAHGAAADAADGPELAEARTACLERCLRKLPEQSRALIVSYYQGRGGAHLEGRKLLAQRLCITYDSLKTRAHRIRNALRVCLHECMEARDFGHQ